MKRILIIVGLILLSTLIVICGMFLNTYLSNNNYLFYAKGIKDKAFLNATWKMSPHEIERANKTSLVKPEWEIVFGPDVTDQKRFTQLIQEKVFLWGHSAKVTYNFFDNMLYEYFINLTTYNLEKPHKEILETLRKQFGGGKEDQDKTADDIHRLEWSTEKQDILYWMSKEDKKEEYGVGIRARYKPFYEQMEGIAKTEKKKYF
jgi:hypothetical protein